MCGFIGEIRHFPKTINEDEKIHFYERSQLLCHRGPDEYGYYFDDYISFGFRRLSIIDLNSGSQPASYGNNRYTIVFNGEIYNFLSLKKVLLDHGCYFDTSSEAEVLTAMFSHYGTDMFSYLRGMFAILIWDKEQQTLYGARDPFGIKPLYYQETAEKTTFSSEKKSIVSHHEEIDEESLQHYMSFQYVPNNTLTKGVHTVAPGHYFVKKPAQPLQLTSYWEPSFQPVYREKQEWETLLRDTLSSSVEAHLQSDVPVGSFLSGGIDSAIIASLAARYKPDLKTFSVGFATNGYSEMDIAAETADKLGIENYRYTVSCEEFVHHLPKIIWHMDDPLADPSCVPLYFLAREARKHVTVVLSGEGSDELFGGYNIYREPSSLQAFQYCPKTIKYLLRAASRFMPKGMKGKSFIERGTTPLAERYIGNAKMFEEEEKRKFLKTASSDWHYRDITGPIFDKTTHLHPVQQMQTVDINTWLRGDILLKADKMTMAHSLELRVPFLDKEVFKVARHIPADLQIANNTTKSILRDSFRGIVPDHVYDRKKLGFPVPIRHWLKNELYDWARSIINDSQTESYIHKAYVLSLLDEHAANKHDHSRKLWTILIFMIWHQVHVEGLYTAERTERENQLVNV
ncbi:asparagine synthase (glutamine-hydrolysing) [Alteribacillus persepolensis]|uniref:asparagine synthase (glutamine-hydrolyzing) n=1 Tax=Alteribacillus persepolensis TaxID=568899 RepID=A0A1G8AAL2_9BACI|nr:asparagine synthase (glutamine-hydrolyzing) [Alteribacillus persepolensis]SDH17978.1 asparagine synthase (glutamine-hydrolysing) [Alteribacillus persepolensis]